MSIDTDFSRRGISCNGGEERVTEYCDFKVDATFEYVKDQQEGSEKEREGQWGRGLKCVLENRPIGI